MALSPQQQQEHRAKIGVRVEAILGQFWRADDTPDAVRAVEIEGWMDVLENSSHTEIRTAWAKYQKTGPRTASGKLYKPDAGALYLLITAARPRPKIVSDRRPATREENEAIHEELERSREVNPERAAQAQEIIQSILGRKA